MLDRQKIEKMLAEMGLNIAKKTQFSQFEEWEKMTPRVFDTKTQFFIELSTTTTVNEVENKGEKEHGELG